MCVAVQEDKVLDLANDLGREGDRYDNRLVVLSLEVRLGEGSLGPRPSKPLLGLGDLGVKHGRVLAHGLQRGFGRHGAIELGREHVDRG